VVAPEIVRLKAKKDAATGLVPGTGALLGSCRASEKKPASRRVWWPDDDPAFPRAHVRVFQERKAQFLREELDRFVVLADEKSYLRNRLHGKRLKGAKEITDSFRAVVNRGAADFGEAKCGMEGIGNRVWRN